MRRLLLLLLVIAAALPATASASSPFREDSFSSQALGQDVNFGVYLPPSYDSSPGTRYPVIYFLHGLPCSDICWSQIWWLGEAMEQSGHEAIIVGAQGNRPGEDYSQWMNHGAGDNWETATATELVNAVDSRYRTIASRDGRAIVGASAGGYGAALIGFHHPGEYSVIQSWSGYFQPTDLSGVSVIDLGSRAANQRASIPSLLPKLRKKMGPLWRRTRFQHYVGAGDDRFLVPNEQLHSELKRVKLPGTTFRVYPGTHGVGLWEDHATEWIGMAASQLSPPQ
jgi:S-formylglutathione hydrolase FrmB